MAADGRAELMLDPVTYWIRWPGSRSREKGCMAYIEPSGSLLQPPSSFHTSPHSQRCALAAVAVRPPDLRLGAQPAVRTATCSRPTNILGCWFNSANVNQPTALRPVEAS